MQVLKRNPNSPFPTPSQVFSEHGGWEMKAPGPAPPCWPYAYRAVGLRGQGAAPPIATSP